MIPYIHQSALAISRVRIVTLTSEKVRYKYIRSALCGNVDVSRDNCYLLLLHWSVFDVLAEL